MAAEKIPGEFHRPSDAVEFYEHHMSDLSSLMKGEMAIYLNENTFYDADGVEVTNAAKKKANVKKYEAGTLTGLVQGENGKAARFKLLRAQLMNLPAPRD